MSWFKRLKDGVQTATAHKKEAPDGVWYKCKRCSETSTTKELKENNYKCSHCNYHVRIGSSEYFELIYDGNYETLFDDLISKDFLKFEDLKPYTKRLSDAKRKTNTFRSNK